VSELTKNVKKEKSERILTFDLMRGYFLCVILFNHLWYYPSGLDIFTGRSLLYASTADGFFVVSGIVLGIVRGAKLINQPFKVAAKLLWKRSIQLYITSIVLTFLFTVVGQLFIGNPGLKWGIYTDWNNWWVLIWETVSLHYTYGWADFLRLYAIFIFFAPFALWLLRKGYWYILVAVSAGLWALYPIVAFDTMIARPLSWQFIFFAGFIIGFHWKTIMEKWRQIGARVRKVIGWSTVGIFALTLLGSAFLVFGHYFGGDFGAQIDALHHVVEQEFNKDRLPVGRLLLGTVWFWGLFFLFRRFEPWIIKYFGWVLLGFGMNSLYVYTISAFVIFFLHLVVPAPGLGNIFLNLLLSIGALLLVHLAVKTKFLMKIIPR